MRKSIGIILMLASMTSFGGSLSVKDNAEIALTLSQSNYNRIVIKDDKITEAVFPPNAMSIKQDAQDGSVYVMLGATNPFTLFLATEGGRHFSITLNAEESLGKTIELVPDKSMPAKALKVENPIIATNAAHEAVLALLNHMEERKPFSDMVIKRQSRAEQWSEGLVFKPKETWDGKLLTGQIIELYNGGKAPLKLEQAWFATDTTLAIKFSKPTIAPKETALLYRVQGVGHG